VPVTFLLIRRKELAQAVVTSAQTERPVTATANWSACAGPVLQETGQAHMTIGGTLHVLVRGRWAGCWTSSARWPVTVPASSPRWARDDMEHDRATGKLVVRVRH